MTPALRLALTAIVLANLAFVHATEDASLTWLAPMYAAAIASPWLARFSGSTVYRWAWNLAVIGIFSVLVHHTATAGPRFLLEDGLRLAAVCQVHVLCTIGARQSPDLLFFNSFLIAVVTAFLTQDTLYCAVFLAYAPLLVTGLALYSSRSGNPAPVIVNALGRTAFALAVTAAVFLVWPRDFHRKGLVVEGLTLGPARAALDVGFSETVRLGRPGSAASNESIVLRATLLAGRSHEEARYWRGATQVEFDGVAWAAGPALRSVEPRWREGATRALERDVPGRGAVFDVELADPSAGRLFTPLSAKSVAVLSPQPEDTPASVADGTLRFLSRGAGRNVHEVRYRLELGGSETPRAGVTRSAAPGAAAALTLLPPTVPREAVRLASETRRSLPAGAPQHAVVEAMREHLAARRDYRAPGAADAARDLTEFVSGRAGGHCEHFATALAVMLRSENIPCRLVTGYMSDEWDPATARLTIRSRDAHAWVEVLDPAAGWYVADPTPSTARAAARSASLLALLESAVRRAWTAVVRFDDAARDALLLSIVSAPRRAAAFVAANAPACAFTVTGAVIAFALLRRLRVRRVAPDVRRYLAYVAKIGIAPRTDETPREFAARAGLLGIPADSAARLEEATRRHEAARFAKRV